MSASIASLVTDWMEHLFIQRGRRPRGVVQYQRVVEMFFKWQAENGRAVDPGQVSQGDITTWQRALFYDQGNVKNSTRASKLSALRSFFSYLAFTGVISADPTSGIPSPKVQPGLATKFSTEELRLLFHAPDRGTAMGLRDLAILKTLYAAGLRISELVGLDLNRVQDSGGYIRLQVLGKGGKYRTMTLRTNPSRTLREWLLIRQGMELDHSALFVRLKGGSGRLSQRHCLNIMKKYAAIIGIDSAEAFLHKLRATFATDLYDSGHDKCPRCGHTIQYVGLVEVQALLGHDSPETTMRYIAISDRVLQRTAIPDKRFNEIERGE
jgi:site-specific recombinase XerD